MRKIFELFKETFDSWNRDHAPRLGAALAYYTIFSLGPLLIIVIAIAGLVFGQDVARQQILNGLQDLVGQQGADFVQKAMATVEQPRANIIASIIGIVTLLLGALGVFGELKESLNTIWGVEPKPGRGIKGLVLDRLLSFGMVLVTGFLLLVSLIVSTAITAMLNYFGGAFTPGILEIANFAISFIVITILFAFIFKYLPDGHVQWGSVWFGAAVTALLFVIGKFAIGFYLGRSQMASAYGAASSVIIVLVWIYYAAQILFFGAELTKVTASKFGKGVIPDDDAQSIANANSSKVANANK